mgnify:CR=1 FL=1
MTAEREQQIVTALQTIVDAFEPSDGELELTMFGLISRYNAQHDNPELIGGDWAAERGFDLPA